MSDNLSAEAELILSVDKFIASGRSAAEILQALTKVVGRTQEQVAGLDKELDAAQRGLSGTGKAVKATAKDVDKGSSQWQDYVKQLTAARKANRDFQQDQVSGATTPGAKGIGDFTGAEKVDLVATAKAQSTDIIREIEREQKAVEAAGQARLKANAAEHAANIRGIEEVGQARLRTNAEAYAAQSAAQSSRGYSNMATEMDQIISDRRRDSSSFAEGVRARMQAQQSALTASHAEANAMNRARDAQEAATRANNDHTTSLISTRYALYDVATTYGILSAAMLGVAGLTVKTAADFESAFSGVERTTLNAAGESVAGLDEIRAALVDLSTEMPVAFDEIARIATLGAQLGVPAEELTNFSEVVAKFSTVTGMTAEATAQAFGRLTNLLGLPISQAEQLGSAIARVGVDSASTEQEIVGLAQRLASTATRAGFTTDQVIGLSGALGSLGVAPERAQGVFETYFNSLNESLSEGGKKLEYFAQVTGLSEEALNQMVRSGEGFTVFQKFLDGLQGADSVQLTAALDGLGLSGLRANEVVGRISGNLPLLNKAFDDANQGFTEGTELQNQYAKVAEDLNMQLVMLGNALLALADAGGSELIPGLAGAIGGLTDLVNGVRSFVDSGFGQQVFRIGTVLTVVTGLIAGYRSIVALSTASTFALVTAQEALAAQGTRGGIAGLVAAVRGLNTANSAARTSALGAAAANEAVATTATGAATATATATTATNRFSTALRVAGRLTVFLGLVHLATEILFNFNGSMQTAADAVQNITGVLSGAANGVADFIGNIASGLPIVGALAKGVATLLSLSGKNVADDFSSWAYNLRDAEEEAGYLTEGLGDLGIGAGDVDDEFSDLEDTTESLTAKVVTLADYASDLGGVMSRAFDIRFGPSQGSDDITSGWNAIAEASAANAKAIADSAEATKEAQQALRDYRAEAAQLNADRSVLLYFKSVADQYGDTLRSAQISAELEKNQNDLDKSAANAAKSQSELSAAAEVTAAAQRASSMSLVGNSAEAIANRAQILGLVTDYQGYLAALAASGMSQEDLRAKSIALKAEFQAQAAQAGFSSSEIDLYAAAFDGMTVAIDGVPRNITVDANTDPAMQALAEFLAAAAASVAEVPLDSSGAGAAGAEAAKEFSEGFSGAFADAVKLSTYGDGSYGQGLGIMANTNVGGGSTGNGFSGGGGGGGGGGAREDALVEEFLKRTLGGSGRKEGGYTGDGGTGEFADFVHGKEFVFSAPAVKNLGVDKLASLHRMAKTGRGYKDGGYVGNGGGGGSLLGGGITSLSPDDRALLRGIAERIGNIEVEFVEVARAAATGDSIIGTRGGR